MDFSENYSCVFQNEVQSRFFDRTQVVIHPMMLYYTVGVIAVKHAIIGITEEVTKDVDTVQAFEEVAISKFHEMNEDLTEVHEWTDGCAAQYKGKRSFRNISQRKSPLIIRNFFETSHGKSVCDGLGAIVKNSCSKAVLSEKAVICNAKSLYDYCQMHLVSEKKWTEAGKTFVTLNVSK